MEVSSFVEKYTNSLIHLLQTINKSEIKNIIDCLEQTLINNSKVYIIGNGGSAATSSHMVNDLGIGLKRRNIKRFNVVSLADNTAVCSAIANDIGYDNIFYTQLQDILTPSDVVIAISCSGNSENIVKAVRYAKEINATIVGMTGFDGGELKNISDISFHIDTNKGEYGLVEDMHMILDHIIYSYYIEQGR